MDHHRLMATAVGAHVLQPEPLREVEVQLDGGELPGTADGVGDVDIDLRPVEGAAALVDHVVKAGRLQGGPQAVGRHLPEGLLPHRLVLRSGRELGLEVLEAEGPQHAEGELQQRGQLVGDLLGRAEDVAVVLCEAPASHEAVDDTGELVAVDGAQLEEPTGQVPVAPLSTLVDRHVERAVHRLRVVDGPVQLHGREHAVGVEVEVATRLPEHRLGDVRAVDEVVAAGLVAVTAVVLDQLPDECALRVPDGQPRPQGFRPRHQVQLGSQSSMVPLLGLDQSVEVPLEGLLVRPGGAVDPLEHRLLLVATPVGTSDLLEGEVSEAPGGRHMRAEAEVDEVLTVAVVGD